MRNPRFNPARIAVIFAVSTLIMSGCGDREKSKNTNAVMLKTEESGLTYQLSSPQTKGSITVEEALSKRRSRREYTQENITEQELSQILWAAYGITKKVNLPWVSGGIKTAPSAGAKYPLNIYVLAGRVKGIKPGVYKYVPEGHKLNMISDKDIKKDLCAAALNQEMIDKAPVCLFYSATYSRTTDKYGARGRERYVCMDLGHSAENVYLQAEALHLGTCAIGAFSDEAVIKVMNLPEEEVPLYIMPIGKYFGE